MDIDKILGRYGSYLTVERGYSDNTRDAYVTDVSKLLNALAAADIDPTKATVDDLRTFMGDLHDLGIMPRSCARILSGIKNFTVICVSRASWKPILPNCSKVRLWVRVCPRYSHWKK